MAMKNFLLSGIMLIYFNGCYSQVSFNEFAKKFNSINLPIENILELTSHDSLNGKLTNDVLFRSQDNKPQFIDKKGKLTPIKQYYGLYPEKPFKYFTIESKNDKWIEVEKYFINKIVPIGQIKLNPNYTSLIIKVVAYETTFYDLWNFSKDGKALSVVCLFWGMRDGGPRDEKITFTIVDSKITKEGNIIWHENADGLETFRTYRLNDEGYFQIIKEEQKGESEF